MATIPIYEAMVEEIGKRIAKDALDGYIYEGKTLREWIDIIKQARWIPVSERLPEETKANYWVCTDSGYQCQCRWTNNLFGLRDGNTWAWSIFDIPQYSKVIAWMPLPESYKAESEDK